MNLLNIIMFVNKNKIIVVVLLAFEKKDVIMRVAWQRSSVVEQRNHNPLVGGPNPSAATRISRCSGIFYLAKIFRFRPNLSVLADIFTYTGHNSGHRKYVYMCNPFACFTL